MLMIDFHNPNDKWLNSELMKDLEPEDAQRIGCATAIGYVLAIIVGLLFCALLGSCSSRNNFIEERRDSVRVETRIETVYVPDTAYIEIPRQSAERVTADSVSHLENDFATSDARIRPDGSLFHTLNTKPQNMPVEVEKKVERKDSIVYVDKIVQQTEQQITEVEKPLSWWQQTQIYGFYVLVVLLVAIYMKPIWSLLRKFILRMTP